MSANLSKTLLIILAAVLLTALQTQACDQTKGGCPPDVSTVYQMANLGLSMSPVPLNYDPSQREMVGYGSYIVNSQASCYGCHTSQVSDPVYGDMYVLDGYMGGACSGGLCSIDLTPGGVPSWLDFNVFSALVRGVSFCSYPGTVANKEELKAVVGSLGPTCASSTGMSYLNCVATNGVYANGTGNCYQTSVGNWLVAGGCGTAGGSGYLQQQRFFRCGAMPAGAGDILQWNGDAWVLVGTTTTRCLPVSPKTDKALAPMFHESLQQMSNADLYAVYAYFKALPKRK